MICARVTLSNSCTRQVSRFLSCQPRPSDRSAVAEGGNSRTLHPTSRCEVWQRFAGKWATAVYFPARVLCKGVTPPWSKLHVND